MESHQPSEHYASKLLAALPRKTTFRPLKKWKVPRARRLPLLQQPFNTLDHIGINPSDRCTMSCECFRIVLGGVVMLMIGCHTQREQTFAQYPDDLQIHGTVGSLIPGGANVVFNLDADGQGQFASYRSEKPGPPEKEIPFTVSDSVLGSLWSEIVELEFFELDSLYSGEEVDDGFFASLTITAHGRTHTVDIENASVKSVESLIREINGVFPSEAQIPYPTGPPDR